MEQGFNLTYNVTFINNFTQEASSFERLYLNKNSTGKFMPGSEHGGGGYTPALERVVKRQGSMSWG